MRANPLRFVDPFGLAVSCGEAARCFSKCVLSFITSKNCEEVTFEYKGVSKTNRDAACKASLAVCLAACAANGFPVNPVCRCNCKTPTPPKPKAPAKDDESALKTAAPHLATTAGEQTAAHVASRAGAHGGADVLGPAVTVAGTLDAAPDTMRIALGVDVRNYMLKIAEDRREVLACDPIYVETVVNSAHFDDLWTVAAELARGTIPLPNA